MSIKLYKYPSKIILLFAINFDKYLAYLNYFVVLSDEKRKQIDIAESVIRRQIDQAGFTVKHIDDFIGKTRMCNITQNIINIMLGILSYKIKSYYFLVINLWLVFYTVYSFDLYICFMSYSEITMTCNVFYMCMLTLRLNIILTIQTYM